MSAQKPERGFEVVNLRREFCFGGKPIIYAGDGVAGFDQFAQGHRLFEPERHAPPCTQTSKGARAFFAGK